MVLRRDASRIKKEAIVKSISNTLNDVKEMDGRDGNSSFQQHKEGNNQKTKDKLTIIQAHDVVINKREEKNRVKWKIAVLGELFYIKDDFLGAKWKKATWNHQFNYSMFQSCNVEM